MYVSNRKGPHDLPVMSVEDTGLTGPLCYSTICWRTHFH